MSAGVARPRLPLARDSTPGPIPFALIVEPIGGRSPRHPRLWWSRPMPVDVCSMFARMPRYASAASGIRSEPRIPATGQNGSSRHVLALLDTSSSSINEQSSGLLIRGFGVQVPGGAPVLTWGFTPPGHFLFARFVPLCARRALGGREREAGRLVKLGPIGPGQPSEPLPMWLRSAIVAGKSRAAGLPSVSGSAVTVDLGWAADSIRTVVACHHSGSARLSLDASGSSWPAPLAAVAGGASRGPLKVRRSRREADASAATCGQGSRGRRIPRPGRRRAGTAAPRPGK